MTDPHADEPLRFAEARAVALNPETGEGLVRALRTVVLFTLADTFALVPEETMWAGYHLDRFFAPLAALEAHLVPLPVRHEMLDRHYTQALDAHEANSGGVALVHYDPAAMHASDADWAAVIMQMVTGCFALRPMDEMTMRGQIAGMLRELGVGDPTNPRGARYLPNDVRHRLDRQG